MEYQLTQKLQYIENIGLKLMADMEEIKKQLSNLQNANRTTQAIAKDSATEVKKLHDNVEIHRQLLMEIKFNPNHVPAGSSAGGEFSDENGNNRNSGGGSGSSGVRNITGGDDYLIQNPKVNHTVNDRMGSTPKTKLDVNNTIEIAKRNVYPSEGETRFGKKECAKKVRETLEESTGKTMARPKSGYAKDYEVGLKSIDFEVVHSVEQGRGYPANDGFKPAPGDVIIINKTSTSKEGHMAIYGGKDKQGDDIWYSDHVQKDAYPGPVYRLEKPSYKIYRHKNRI